MTQSVNQKYKILISNFSYLLLIELVNKFLPLLVVPYIIGILGLEKYGIIAFSLAIIMYFKILTAYSFDLTATKFISEHRKNKKIISEYYWNVIFTKIFLLFISFVILLSSIYTFEKLFLEKEVIFFTFLMLIGEVMTPLWFFRGIEEMKYVAYLNLMIKLLYTISIFIFIHQSNDYFLIPLLSSISYIFVGIVTLLYIHNKFKISFVFPKKATMKNLLIEGKDIFFSNMSVSLYSTTNSVLLGFLAGFTAVGIYAIAEAIYGAFLQLINTYNTVVYPHLAKYLHNKIQFIHQARKLFLLYIGILIGSSILIYLLSDFIITLLFGEGHKTSIEILQILTLVLILTPIGGYLTHYLALKSEYKKIRKITFLTMLVNFIFVYPLLITYEAKGMAYLMLLLSIFQVLLNITYNQELFKTSSRLKENT